MPPRKAHRGPAAAPTCDDSFEGCPSLLEVSQPLLPHLTAEERLACFRTCHGMATLVAGHAPSTKLCLDLRPPTAKEGAPSPCTHALAAQQLAAQSSNLALTLQGRLLSPAQCLWPRITSLCLDRLWLSAADISGGGKLQLHRLVHLHTLRIRGCRLAATRGSSNSSGGGTGIGCGSSSGGASASQQPSLAAAPPKASTVRTLEVMNYRPESTGLFASVLALVDPAQLQTVTTDDASAPTCLDQMTTLQELHLRSTDVVDDQVFQSLLNHPSLLRVELADVNLNERYTTHPCRWESLCLVAGASVRLLAALPLASIKTCVVRASLSLEDPHYRPEFPRTEQAWAAQIEAEDAMVWAAVINVRRCHVVFKPIVQACDWEPKQPTFRLCMDDCEHPATQAAPIFLLVARRVADGGALSVSTNVTSSFTMLEALASLPPAITTLSLDLNLQYDELDELEEEGVLTHLPEHVSHVVLLSLRAQVVPGGPNDDGTGTLPGWLRMLPVFMRGVTRPLTLTLLQDYYEDPWNDESKAAVRELVWEQASPRVEVVFQQETVAY